MVVILTGSKCLSWKYYKMQKTVFMHLAITPPKVNPFGWNLEHCEHIVGGWPWQILGAISAVATFWEVAEIFFCEVNNARFHPFPVGQISRNLNATTSISVLCKLSEYNFENFTLRGSKNCGQNFQILLLQADITTQWYTDCREFVTRSSSYGMSSFYIYR